jgi:hypothetical protein
MAFTVTRSYDHFEDARSVIIELKGVGIAEEDISVIAHDEHRDVMQEADDVIGSTESSAGTGASIGGAVGGGAGLLTGLGLMAIPGVGPLVAAGWLATTAAGVIAGALAGAATGGVVDALTSSGVQMDDAETYAETVRRGGILVSVRGDDEDQSTITTIMDRHNPVNVQSRRSEWESQGWTGYNSNQPPYNPSEVRAEQERYRQV